MIINTNNNFVHIAIPRTATTCLNVALGNLTHPEPAEHHCSIGEVLKKHPNTKAFYKFTFVRNPFDKLVSTYFEFRKNRKTKYSGKISYEKELLSEFDLSNSDTENFRNFCRNFGDTKWRDDLFFKSQFDFINVKGQNVMDYIGLFENLDEGWKKIRKEINLESIDLQKSVPQEPRGFIRGSYHPPYQELYTETEKKIVQKIYKKDLEYFNYSF